MEGLVDPLVRQLWTQIGGYDLCTTEFIRITDQTLSRKVFLRDAPELNNDSKTLSGTPVMIQLLGGNADRLAENAKVAVDCGAYGIDLNFGCPAPTVNRHDGGATLLKCPDRIFTIVSAVRKAVPANIPVSAKMRLGFSDTTMCLQNARAIAEGGACRLTIHCRTKVDFYRPPAYWEWIPAVREHLSSHGHAIDLVANGEIWSLDDFIRCRGITNATSYMIGRGAVANPYLALRIKAYLAGKAFDQDDWQMIEKLIPRYFELCLEQVSSAYAVSRIKQLLKTMMPTWPQAATRLEQIKRILDHQEMRHRLVDLETDRLVLRGF